MATIADREVDNWVESFAMLPLVKFYPGIVAKATNLPLKDVFNRLLFLANDNVLILSWEIICPNYDCVRTITTIDEKEFTLNSSANCNVCGEVEISEENIFPSFRIDPCYKEYIKKKYQTTPKNLLKKFNQQIRNEHLYQI